MESIISVKGIEKTYKISKRAKGLPSHVANLFVPRYTHIKAVDGLDLEIGQGESVGFIGANGAGKSTTIKMLCGILSPTRGTVQALGLSPHKQRKRYVGKIGAVFGQKSQLAWDLPIIDSFELLQKVYSIPKEEFNKTVAMFTELLEMDFINQPVRQLSLGQRMRADIAAALLHKPKLVFFDEPTIGLDVVAKERIRQFIRHMNREEGITMIFTTHDMQDIEKTCDRLIIIDEGKKLYDGTVEGIEGHFGSQRKLIVQFDRDYTVENIGEVEVTDRKNHVKEFTFESSKVAIKELIQTLLDSYNVVDLTIQEPEIEEIVRKIYQGGL